MYAHLLQQMLRLDYVVCTHVTFMQHIRRWQQRGTWLCTENVKHRGVLNEFLFEHFPSYAKWSTSGVFWAEFGCQVIQVLRDQAAGDKNLLFFIKKKTWIWTSSLDLKKALVVPVKKNSGYSICLWLSLIWVWVLHGVCCTGFRRQFNQGKV